MATLPPSETAFTLDIEQINDGAFSVDGNHHIVAWNHAAERLFDCPAGEAIGRRCSAVMSHHLGAACLVLQLQIAAGSVPNDLKPKGVRAWRRKSYARQAHSPRRRSPPRPQD